MPIFSRVNSFIFSRVLRLSNRQPAAVSLLVLFLATMPIGATIFAAPGPAASGLAGTTTPVEPSKKKTTKKTKSVYLWKSGLKLVETPTQGQLMHGWAQKNSEVFINDQPIKVAVNGRFIFAISRDQIDPIILKMIKKNGKSITATLIITPREWDIQRIDNLPTETVSPNPEGLKRIVEDSALIRQSRKQITDETGFYSKLAWPTIGRLSGIFGSQRILNGKPHAFHAGIDIAAPLGTQLCSPANGRVSLVAPNLLLTGNTVAIDHGMGLSSVFAHLSEISVTAGQQVKRGELIGLIGMTGRVTGPHVHWGMFWTNIAIDPEKILPKMPKQNENYDFKCRIQGIPGTTTK